MKAACISTFVYAYASYNYGNEWSKAEFSMPGHAIRKYSEFFLHNNHFSHGHFYFQIDGIFNQMEMEMAICMASRANEAKDNISGAGETGHSRVLPLFLTDQLCSADA